MVIGQSIKLFFLSLYIFKNCHNKEQEKRHFNNKLGYLC